MCADPVVPELAVQGQPARSQTSTYTQASKRPAHAHKATLAAASATNRLKGYALDLPQTAGPAVQPPAQQQPTRLVQQASGQAPQAFQRPKSKPGRALQAPQAANRPQQSTDASPLQAAGKPRALQHQHQQPSADELDRQNSSPAGVTFLQAARSALLVVCLLA